MTKTKVKKRSAKISVLTAQAKKRTEKLDQMLLKLAPGPYGKILKQIQSSKRRIDEERRLALQLGDRILKKVKEVRDSLPLARQRRPITPKRSPRG